jgi:hypothetical protein
MANENDMQRLAALARQYRSLSLAEEKAGKGEVWKQEYWSIVDRLIDVGQFDRPLDDQHLIDWDFWSDKYYAFWNAYRERHLPWYYKAIRWVILTPLRWIESRRSALL